MRLTPIDLHDDGLRLTAATTTRVGNFPIVHQHNPEHIAHVIQEKSRRALIRENNYRHWN